MKRGFFLIVIVLCTLSAESQKKKLPYVILISLDGFSSEYIRRYDLPNFKSFVKEGAEASGLIPSFPSKTFPNHYTIVTGLYPGHHGLVDNYFYDPDRNATYSMRNREAVTDSIFYGGIPLWRLARKHSIKSASYFWVGSEIKHENLHPDYYYDYDQSTPFQNRVDQVITWLKLPEKERPHLITLYFSSPDTESHTYGPFAEETKGQVLGMDSLLGAFMHRIDLLNLPVNVILVSDHGMSELTEKPETYILLDELVVSKPDGLKVVNGGTQAHIYTSSNYQKDSLYTMLKEKARDFSVIRREDFPERWHYDNKRSGDLLITANPGKYIVSGDRNKLFQHVHSGKAFGVHGYDPDLVNEMYGIFYAKGPNIKPGSKIPAFRNIHIYPLIAQILRLKTPAIDGSFSVLSPIYRR